MGFPLDSASIPGFIATFGHLTLPHTHLALPPTRHISGVTRYRYLWLPHIGLIIVSYQTLPRLSPWLGATASYQAHPSLNAKLSPTRHISALCAILCCPVPGLPLSPTRRMSTLRAVLLWRPLLGFRLSPTRLTPPLANFTWYLIGLFLSFSHTRHPASYIILQTYGRLLPDMPTLPHPLLVSYLAIYLLTYYVHVPSPYGRMIHLITGLILYSQLYVLPCAGFTHCLVAVSGHKYRHPLVSMALHTPSPIIHKHHPMLDSDHSSVYPLLGLMLLYSCRTCVLTPNWLSNLHPLGASTSLALLLHLEFTFIMNAMLG
jgi:hypothetical protein